MKKKLLIVTLCAALLLNLTAPRSKAFDLVITPTAAVTALAIGAAAGLVITKGNPVEFYNEKLAKYTNQFGTNLLTALEKTQAVATSGGKAILQIGSVAYAEAATFFAWLKDEVGITSAGQTIDFGEGDGLPDIGGLNLYPRAFYNDYPTNTYYYGGSERYYGSIDPKHFWVTQMKCSNGYLYTVLVADEVGHLSPYRFRLTDKAGTVSGSVDRELYNEPRTVPEWKTVSVLIDGEPQNIYYYTVTDASVLNKQAENGWHGEKLPYLTTSYALPEYFFNALSQTVVSVPSTGTLETTDVYDGDRSETALGTSPLEYVPATNAYDIGANYQIEDIHNWAQELLDAYSRGLADGQVMDIAGTQVLAGTDAEVVAGEIQFAGDYTVGGLDSIFPFCIPFDIVDMFKALQSNRVTPHFELPFYIPHLVDYTIVIDLSDFDGLAQTARTMELLCFGIALAVATRKLIRG